MSPPTTSELIFSSQANHNFSKTLGELKRSTLSIRNRLESIEHDAVFAREVAQAYRRPLIANERCGSWYIDPQIKGGSAYFKSTDGHTGVWKFSSRRLNLHLLEIIGTHDGCIIVDSTRRGKRMPDALSKTIPIWCSVVNRFLFANDPLFHSLYTPPQVVSDSEHAQISVLLPSFVMSLKALGITMEDLKKRISKPVRPIWVTPDSQPVPTTNIFHDYHPIICCTISRRVAGGELSEAGYIQGAGDDTENWAHGLTPPVFWAHKQLLLSTPEAELPELIESLVRDAAVAGPVNGGIRCIEPTSSVYVASIAALGSSDTMVNTAIITLLPEISKQSAWQRSRSRLEVGLGPHKTGRRNLRAALPFIIGFLEKALSANKGAELLDGTEKRILLACETGTDLSIGVALAILCRLFEDNGSLSMSLDTSRPIDKAFIRSRLGWISTSMPHANPTRDTLQSVNSYLMERPK